MPVAREESCKDGGDLWWWGWGGNRLQGAMNMSCHKNVVRITLILVLELYFDGMGPECGFILGPEYRFTGFVHRTPRYVSPCITAIDRLHPVSL